jgi:thiamine biosynthesis lipoprotein
MKKPLFLLAAACMLAVLAYQKWVETPFYHVQSYVFGTMVDITIVGEPEPRARELANHVLQDFQHLHQRLHAWKPVSVKQLSELQMLNAAFAQKNSVNVAPDIANMLREITALSIQSQGLFNPAIGHLIQVWGFQRDEFTAMPVDKSQIQALVKQNPQMSDILIEHQMAKSQNAAVNVDLGGYAKGYALDMAVHSLKAQKVKNALVNIGGNIIALGQHGDKPWRVGIQHPRKPEAIATLDLPDGWAIGTSGDYQRYFELNGLRYCHLIDPRTGYPVQHTQAVTVLIPPQATGKAQAGVLSDVVSKPIFIEDWPNKTNIANQLGIKDYMAIDQQAHIHVTRDLLKKLNWVASDVKFSTFQ